MRLDKLLALNGFGSRKDIRLLLKKHTVRYNGLLVKTVHTHIHVETDTLTIDDMPITLTTHVYLMFHKPKGCVTANHDTQHQTVMDFLPPKYAHARLFAVGRLDKDTEGLLIITNDGMLTHRLSSPKTNCVKTYYLELDRLLSDDEIVQFSQKVAAGLQLASGVQFKKAQFEQTTPLTQGTSQAFLLHLREGKHHQVKRMCKTLNCSVTRLKRICFAGLMLDPHLSPGKMRDLSQQEIDLLHQI